jgi:SM-20-related protein
LSVSEQLIRCGVAVQDQFLTGAEVLELTECLEARRTSGGFKAAQVGSGQNLRRRPEIRGDSTCWLDAPLMAPEVRLLDSLEELRLQLNRAALLGLFELELHYAAYPPSAGYARHVDQPRGNNRRQVSLVLYLNRQWHAGAGGELRIYDADEGYRDVEPIGGRLVCFMTEAREHCVLPTLRERLSITGWFGTRD